MDPKLALPENYFADKAVKPEITKVRKLPAKWPFVHPYNKILVISAFLGVMYLFSSMTGVSLLVVDKGVTGMRKTLYSVFSGGIFTEGPVVSDLDPNDHSSLHILVNPDLHVLVIDPEGSSIGNLLDNKEVSEIPHATNKVSELLRERAETVQTQEFIEREIVIPEPIVGRYAIIFSTQNGNNYRYRFTLTDITGTATKQFDNRVTLKTNQQRRYQLIYDPVAIQKSTLDDKWDWFYPLKLLFKRANIKLPSIKLNFV